MSSQFTCRFCNTPKTIYQICNCKSNIHFEEKKKLQLKRKLIRNLSRKHNINLPKSSLSPQDIQDFMVEYNNKMELKRKPKPIPKVKSTYDERREKARVISRRHYNKHHKSTRVILGLEKRKENKRIARKKKYHEMKEAKRCN